MSQNAAMVMLTAARLHREADIDPIDWACVAKRVDLEQRADEFMKRRQSLPRTVHTDPDLPIWRRNDEP